jgi:peroxiredoxin
MRTRLLILLVPAACAALFFAQVGRTEDKPPANLGKKVADFTLTDPRDQSRVSLSQFRDKKAVVVVFLGTECPISNAFLPRLAELHEEYAPRGVQFLGINSNVQDTAERIAEHARKNAVPFPVLKDDGSRVADDFEAVRLSEAFVLDAGAKIRYRGRIDDQFGVNYRRPKPTRRDLAEALGAVLAGKEVAQPTAPAAGCRIGRAVKPKAAGAVTYSKQVSRILQKNCQECHRPGQIGPMALLDYESARDWSETIREVIQDGRMPPWFADPHYGKFDNDRRLPPEERDQLLAWIDQGCPRGDDSELPPPRQFTPGWGIGKPDAVVTMDQEFDVPATAPLQGIDYKYFTVDPHFTEDRWVVAAEARAGAPEVVHHIIVFVLAPGQKFHEDNPGNVVLCGSAPGDTALRLPAGTAKKVPAGSKLIFQLHYTPNGKATKDRSSVGMILAKGPPEQEARTVPVLNPYFRIPAGADSHRVESRFRVKDDAVVLGFMPHMHLRGKDFAYEAIYPDGKTETLLSVPHFNFNWQSSYRLATPLRVPKGTVIHCTAHFDNSAGNPNNPDPAVNVTWGDQTWEEMMIGWTEIAYERK